MNEVEDNIEYEDTIFMNQEDYLEHLLLEYVRGIEQ